MVIPCSMVAQYVKPRCRHRFSQDTEQSVTMSIPHAVFSQPCPFFSPYIPIYSVFLEVEIFPVLFIDLECFSANLSISLNLQIHHFASLKYDILGRQPHTITSPIKIINFLKYFLIVSNIYFYSDFFFSNQDPKSTTAFWLTYLLSLS